MKTRFLLIVTAFLLATLSPPLSAQEAYRVDPFYQSRLDEGRTLFLQGDYPGAIQSIELAYIGFLDNPDKLLECYVYLSLGHGEMKSWERAEYYRNEIRRLNLRERLPNLDLPAAVKARIDEFSAVAAPPEIPASPAPRQPTPPSPPAAVPAKMDVAKAAPFILQARAEKNLNKKIAFYKQALAFDPTDLNTWFEINDVYFEAKKYRAGADLMEALLLAYPENLRLLTKLAESYLADRSFKKAFPVLVKAAELDAESVEVRYLLGRAYVGLKRYADALAELDYVLSRSPGYKDASPLRQACAAKIK